VRLEPGVAQHREHDDNDGNDDRRSDELRSVRGRRE
jgi:hypothetical protein